MRGKLLGNDVPDELERITPADAGKTDTKQFQARKK